MILKSFFQKLFLGEILIEKIKSPINGEIKVYDGWFGRSMRIGGVTQSGGLVEKLWEKILNFKFLILNQFKNSNFKCLILGLGCGTLAKLMSEKFPESRIVGVEIDPIVVEVGKKYFGLGEIKNLEIVVGDAMEKVKSHISEKFLNAGKLKFDLIVVDLYVGKEFPKEAGSEEFLNGLKNILTSGGLIVFNCLYYNKGYQEKADKFLARVKSFFPEVKTKTVVTNLLILASF